MICLSADGTVSLRRPSSGAFDSFPELERSVPSLRSQGGPSHDSKDVVDPTHQGDDDLCRLTLGRFVILRPSLCFSLSLRPRADSLGTDGPSDVEKALGTLGPKLLQRFSSDEGYRAFDEAHQALQAFMDMGVRTGVLSNADSRIRASPPHPLFPPYSHANLS